MAFTEDLIEGTENFRNMTKTVCTADRGGGIKACIPLALPHLAIICRIGSRLPGVCGTGFFILALI